jgi:tetratricopeptide (TPR) repeat protein
MKKFIYTTILTAFFAVSAFAQLQLPQESNKATVSQVVGDTTISITYFRPNVKGRTVWGDLVPYDKVWRSGANNATVFEINNDVTINGQALPKGKYSLHSIPTATDVTLIFNKTWDQWGSFNYDEKQDQLRVKVKPQTTNVSRETLMYEFEGVKDNSTEAILSWEKWRIPFTVNVGDIYSRTLGQIRNAIQTRATDDVRPLNQGAGYVFASKKKENYDEALGWLDTSIKTKEGFGNLSAKARLLAEMGKKKEAIATGEKAIQVGKAASPAANTADFEKTLAGWKAGK